MPVILKCVGLGGVILAEAIDAPPPVGTYLQGYELSRGAGRFQWTPDRHDALVFAVITDAMATWHGIPQLQVLTMVAETGPPFRAACRDGRWITEDLTTGSPYPAPGELDRARAIQLAWQLNKTFIDEGGLK